MIDFSIPDDERLVVASIRKFIEREVLPWEPVLIQRGLRGEPEYLSRDEEKALQLKAKAFGYWGLDTPEPYGGADLTPVVQALIWMELGRTFVPFRFGGSGGRPSPSSATASGSTTASTSRCAAAPPTSTSSTASASPT